MEIKKQTEARSSGTPTAEELEAINAQAKASLTAAQVYVFSLRLCDDQVDRDGERFDTAALPELARLFVGKTGVVDHHWSSDAQVARIFRTQVVSDKGVNFIKAWAYIRRGGRADEVIADIEAGIKKEVSVGCAMGRAVCSICGGEAGACGHQKGQYYDGQLCCAILKEPVDAYEFSFVAVPAQREAGVMKGLGGGKRSLKELADAFGAGSEYRGLYKLAQLGRAYEKQLQDRAVRMGLVLELGLEEPVLRSMTQKLGAEELELLVKALEERSAEVIPGTTQLVSRQAQGEPMEAGYLI